MPDPRKQHKEIPFSGKWMTGEPAAIGQNFRTLKNMRYTDTHIRGVSGMTKINTAALSTYLKTRSAFHFLKSQPAESHILAQAYNTGLTASQVIQNITAIPSAGSFSAVALWADSAGGGIGRFSNAPDGQVIYANGVDTCIWGGQEISVGAFVTSTAAVADSGSATNPRDYTDVINNTKTDGNNVATIGGGIDSFVGLLLHCDGVDGSTTFTDSATSGAAKSVTAIGGTDAQIDTTWAAFGTGSLLLDGTGDGLTTADHADFTPAGAFTFDKIVKFAALPAANQAMVIYSQRADASNMALLTLKNLGGVYSFDLILKTAGANAYPIKDLAWTTPVAGTVYHIALIRGWGATANSWTIAINGTSLGAQTSAATYPNVAAAFQLGAGTAEVISSYPPAHSDTYVKATSKSSTDHWPYFATDPSKSLTGVDTGNTWKSNSAPTNQRIHFDVGAAIVLSRFYYENYADSGTATDRGVKTFTLWGSNTAAAFADTTYATNTNWTQLTCSHPHFEQHAAADASDPQYITVTNSTAYRYYAFKFADNWGNATIMGVRRIELNPVTAINANWNIDEVRWSNTSAGGGIARWTANFTPPARPYTAASRTWLVGSPRPLQGVKYYISNANGTASTMTGKEWNGSAWSTLSLTDNTNTGASLAATGTVTFASTVATAKPKYLEGYFLYWYQFSIDAGEAEIYRVTLDAPFQGIVDMWDGIFREVLAFYKFTTAYLDNTVNVLAEDYDSGSALTYSDLSSMGAFSAPNNCLEIGFTEKMAGLKLRIAPEYTNSTASTVMAVDYWNGTEYASVGNITDGTSEGSISLAKSGVVSWNNNSLSNETKKVVANSSPLYYYRVRFDKAMDASVRLNYVGGITAQKSISYFKFPVFAQGRVLLCADMSEEKNKVVCSSKFMPQVYNGIDSVDLYFGEEGELTCGAELFSQFGASLYSLILMFKDTETWIVAGTDIAQWENNTFLLSSSIGCPAPLTLKTINLHAEPGAGINRSLAIWQGTNGVYMSDGRAPIPIHGDIKEYFDRQDSRCIRPSLVGDSVGFIDQSRQEYHLLIASGSAATSLNTELVYDIARNKWFEIDRTAELQCGVDVKDTDGNSYAYGFLDTGYMERLEYGNTFDGTALGFTVHFGDIALGGLAIETRFSTGRLFTVAKTTTGNNITCTHYADTSATGTAQTMSPARTGYRVAMPKYTNKYDADPFHSWKFEMTTSDEAIGFEPLAFVATYHPTHQDT